VTILSLKLLKDSILRLQQLFQNMFKQTFVHYIEKFWKLTTSRVLISTLSLNASKLKLYLKDLLIERLAKTKISLSLRVPKVKFKKMMQKKLRTRMNLLASNAFTTKSLRAVVLLKLPS